MRASECASQALLKYLLEKGAHVNILCKLQTTALYRAVVRGHQLTVQQLLEVPNGLTCLNLQTQLGLTPLMAACMNGFPEIVKILIEKGAAVDIQDKQGDTALMHTVIQLMVSTSVNYDRYDWIIKYLVNHAWAKIDLYNYVSLLLPL